VILDTARHNQIETLTLCDRGENYCMTRIPGGDLDGVERHLSQGGVTGIWTTVSFVYPLLFECHEAFAVSDTFFGYPIIGAQLDAQCCFGRIEQLDA